MRFIFLLILLGTASLQAAEFCHLVQSAVAAEFEAGEPAPTRSRPFLRVLFYTRQEYLAAAATDALRPTDLIVVDEMPTDVDPQVVAGIVSRKAVPPFSHLAIAAAKMRIPLMVSQETSVWDFFRRHQQNEIPQIVELVPDGDRFRIEIKPSTECPGCETSLVQAPVDRGFRDMLTRKQMQTLSTETLRSRFGEKIANLIRAVQGDEGSRHSIPERMTGLPFGAYFQYLEATGLKGLIDAKIAECEKAPDDHALVSRNLETIRRALLENEIPDAMLAKFVAGIENTAGNIFRNLRFRSTNDMEDSLGAGVYQSVFLPRSKHQNREERIREISESIRTVWSSLYTYRAFQVRRLYGLQEKEAAMAVLIHPSVENAVATGVASVRSYYGNVVATFVAYRGDESATSPTAGSRFDHFLISRNPNHEVVVYKDGKPLPDPKTAMEMLSYEAYEDLLSQMSVVLRYWHGPKKFYDHPMDVELSFEWVVLEGNKHVLLQVKPRALVDQTPAAPEVSRYIPPDVVAGIREKTRDPELDALVQPLATQGFLPLKDFILRTLDYKGDVPDLPYFVLGARGRTFVMVFESGSHLTNYLMLKGHFEPLGISFQVVDFGRFNLEFFHSGGALYLRKVKLSNPRDYDQSLGLGPATPERLRAHINALTLGGAILIAKNAEYFVMDEAYFPRSAEARNFAHGNLNDLVRP